MRVLAILALGTTLLAAPLTAQAAPASSADPAPQAVAAAWPSCVKVVRTKLNNEGWNDYKWVVDVTNNCGSGISYNVTRNGSSDYGYRDVAAGKHGSTYTGKLSFGHDASKPDGVKMYYKGTKYTKTF